MTLEGACKSTAAIDQHKLAALPSGHPSTYHRICPVCLHPLDANDDGPECDPSGCPEGGVAHD
jgi:hypothetical protein